MNETTFVDTNILVYSRDSGHPAKQERAKAILEELWGNRKGRLSMQVLQEYYTTVTRKLKPGLPRNEAREDIESLLLREPLRTDALTLRRAWKLEDRSSLSWWDSLIVASALEAGCRFLLTEDMPHGLEIEGLTLTNPFRSSVG